MEYKIPFGKYKRIDYIICYRNNAIIIEFGIDNKKDTNYTTIYNVKLDESIQYKEILSNILTNKKIYIYPFIYYPQNCEENIEKNKKNIEEFSEYLDFIFNNDYNAFEELINLNLIIDK